MYTLKRHDEYCDMADEVKCIKVNYGTNTHITAIKNNICKEYNAIIEEYETQLQHLHHQIYCEHKCRHNINSHNDDNSDDNSDDSDDDEKEDSDG